MTPGADLIPCQGGAVLASCWSLAILHARLTPGFDLGVVAVASDPGDREVEPGGMSAWFRAPPPPRNRLLAARLASGLGIDAVARDLGMDAIDLLKIESGESKPPMHVVRAMADRVATVVARREARKAELRRARDAKREARREAEAAEAAAAAEARAERLKSKLSAIKRKRNTGGEDVQGAQ